MSKYLNALNVGGTSTQDSCALRDTSTAYLVRLSAPTDLNETYTVSLPIAKPASGGVALQVAASGSSQSTCVWGAAFNSDAFRVRDSTDASKQLSFDVSALTSSSLQTIGIPARSVNLGSLSNSGFESWTPDGNGKFWSLSGTTFTVLCSGTGYIAGQLVKWTGGVGQQVTLAAHATNFVYCNASGVMATASSAPDELYVDNVMLFEVFSDGDQRIAVRAENHCYKFPYAVSRYLHDNVGPVIRGSGAVMSVVPGQPRRLAITADTYEDHGLITPIAANSTGITIRYYYYKTEAAAYTWQNSGVTTDGDLTPYYYTGTGTPTAIGAGQFAVYRMFMAGLIDEDGNGYPSYVAVVQTTQYSDQAAAEAAVAGGSLLSPTNELANMEFAQLGYVIMSSTPEVVKVVVLKSTFSAKYSGSTGTTTSHLGLTELDGGTYGDGGHGGVAALSVRNIDPTAAHDISTHRLGSLWLNTTNKAAYIQTVGTAGSALWSRINSRRANLFYISTASSDFPSIAAAVEWLSTNMTGPSSIVVDAGTYAVTSTVVINLSYPLLIRGEYCNITSLTAGTGLTGLKMFDVRSPLSLRTIRLDASTLTDYGKLAGEDALVLTGSTALFGTRLERVHIKGFNKAISFLGTGRLGVDRCSFEDPKGKGIEVNTTASDIDIRISGCDFTNTQALYNVTHIDLVQATKNAATTTQIDTATFSNKNAGDVCVKYDGANYAYNYMSITDNLFENYVGSFLSGFDFSLVRDADIVCSDNINFVDKKPICKINVVDNTTTTTCAVSNTYYVVQVNNVIPSWSSPEAVKVTAYALNGGTAMKYLPSKTKDGIMWISGSLAAGTNGRSVGVTLRKTALGGAQTTYSGMRTYCATSNQQYSFSLVSTVYGTAKDDIYELMVTCIGSNNLVVTVANVQWLAQFR